MALLSRARLCRRPFKVCICASSVCPARSSPLSLSSDSGRLRFGAVEGRVQLGSILRSLSEFPLDRCFSFFRARTHTSGRQRVSASSKGRGKSGRGVNGRLCRCWRYHQATSQPLGFAHAAGSTSPGGVILRAHGLPRATGERSLDFGGRARKFMTTVEVGRRRVASGRW